MPALQDEGHGPSADVLVLVVDPEMERLGLQPWGVEGPERAETKDRVRVTQQLLEGGLGRRRHRSGGERPLVDQSARTPDVPFVLVGLKLHELGVAQLSQIHLHRPGVAVRELVDPAVGGVRLVVVVALAGVGPVGDVDAAVGSVLTIQPAEPGVVAQQEILLVPDHDARALGLDDVMAHPVAVEIEREEVAAVRVGPVVAEIDHRAHVGVTAAGLGMLLARAGVGPVAARPVDVVGGARHQSVNRRRRLVLAEHPVEVGAGNHLEDVLDHAVGDEAAADLVPIEPPRVGRAVADDLELPRHRMEAPDAAVQGDALRVGRAGLADSRVGENPVAGVEPAVGSPHRLVEDVMLRLEVPAVEEDLDRAVGDVVVVAVGQEEEVGDRGQPDAAVAPGDARDVRELVGEDLLRVELPVTVGVLVDHDAVASLLAGLHPFGIGEALDDPEPAPIVERESHGLDDVGLAGEEGDLESFGDGHLPRRFFRLERSGLGEQESEQQRHHFTISTGRGAASAVNSFISKWRSSPKQNSSGILSTPTPLSMSSFRLSIGWWRRSPPTAFASSAAADSATTLARGPTAITVTGPCLNSASAHRAAAAICDAWMPSGRSPTAAAVIANRKPWDAIFDSP